MTRGTILYISLNSATEPLVATQVVAYLRGLAQDGWRFELLTFEPDLRAEALADTRRLLTNEGIVWHTVGYHSGLGLVSAAINLQRGRRKAAELASGGRFRFVHARSYIPAAIARSLKHRIGLPYLFDIRGFWVDEKAYKGSIREGGTIHRLLKRWEQRLFADASEVVSLADAARPAISALPVWKTRPMPPFTVIPTCVDVERFSVNPSRDSSPVFGYIGSLGAGYMPAEVCRWFSVALNHWPDAQLLIVSRTAEDVIWREIDAAGVPKHAVRITSAGPAEIPQHLAGMSAALCFIEPHFSKLASCPTKLGEYLAAGLPVVANDGIGDTGPWLQGNACGVVISDFSDESLRASVDGLATLLQDAGHADRSRATAKALFSLDGGIEAYQRVYERLELAWKGEVA